MTTKTPAVEATALPGFALIPVDQVHPSPDNPRERLTFIAELARSINEVGLLQPIVVQKLDGPDARFQIVMGHRRFAAVKRLRHPTVACIVRKRIRGVDELLVMLAENNHRADLDLIEEARAFTRLRNDGQTVDDICRRIGRAEPYVYARLQLLALPVEEQEELRHGRMTLTEGLDKARVASGNVGKRSKAVDRAWHFAYTHTLASNAKARCERLKHKAGRKVSGGIACGECWESVIRANERQHLHDVSDQKGKCVLCDTEQVGQ